MGFRNILIIKLGGLGDILMSTPAIRALRAAHPSAKITVMVGRSVKEALERNPYIDGLLEVDDNVFFKGTAPARLLLFAGLVRKLRKGAFDLAVIMHRDWKYGLLLKLAGVPEITGFVRPEKSGFHFNKGVAVKAPMHEVLQYVELVKTLGAAEDGLQMDFIVRDETLQKALTALKGAGLDPERLIGISPGGAKNAKLDMETKRWPAGYFKELISRLSKDGFSVVVLGARSDEWFLRDWQTPKGVVSLIGKATLEETAAYLTLCKAAVANDSGPMHLASAVKTPVISIFGPTDPGELFPLNPGSFYFWKKDGLECAPCYKNGVFPACPDKRCMHAVTVDEVYAKVVEVFGRGNLKGLASK